MDAEFHDSIGTCMYSTRVMDSCRLCIKKTVKMYELVNHHHPIVQRIVNMIQYCTSLQVLQNDGLPQFICETCLINLTIAYQLKGVSLHSDQKLRSMVRNTKLSELQSKQYDSELKLNLFESEDLRQNDLEYLQNVNFMAEMNDEDFMKLAEDIVVKNVQVNVGNEYLSNEKNITTTTIPGLGPVQLTPVNIQIAESSITVLNNDPNQSVIHDLTQSQTFTQDSASKGQPKQLYILTTVNETPMIVPIDKGFPVKLQDVNKKGFLNTESNTAGKEKNMVIPISKNTMETTIIIQHSITKRRKRKELMPIKCQKCNKFFTRLYRHKCGPKDIKSKLNVISNGEISNETDEFLIRNKKRVYRKRKTSLQLECELCCREFGTIKQYNRHKYRAHRDLTCEFCGKKYTDLSTYNTHRKAHLGPRHQCDHCEFKTAYKENLQKHIQNIHSGLKPLMCEYCPRTFFSPSNLKSHINRMHLGIRNQVCHICQRKFYDKATLSKHVDAHNQVKRYQCEICKACLSQRGQWKRHMLRQHAIKVPLRQGGFKSVFESNCCNEVPNTNCSETLTEALNTCNSDLNPGLV